MKQVKVKTDGALNKLSLDSCLDYFFGESQASPHDAIADAESLRRVSEEGAKCLGSGSLKDFLRKNSNLVKWWVE